MDSVVQLEAIRKQYRMGSTRVEVLKGVSLRLGRGEYVVIMGPSGSGKSTLLNIIGLLDTPDSGDYFLDGENVARVDDDHLARQRNAKIGFIFQSFNLFPQFDILGNIEVPMSYLGLARGERRERARELAEQVGLGHRLGHRPRELSGGEMQRTAIARALANNPQLLLADEPTGNLDEKTGQEILGLFDRLVAQGRTLLVVTHNPALKDRASRILVMRGGELVP